MCGGEGSRLEGPHEKPLFPIRGVPMVDRVLEALAASRVQTVYAAVSPNAPATREHLAAIGDRDGEPGDRHRPGGGCTDEDADSGPAPVVVETAGDGYVADLQSVLSRPGIDRPILTVAADLPLLDGDAVDRLLAVHRGRDVSRTVCVPVSLKRRLGVGVETTLESRDHLAPTGVNVVGTTTHEESPMHLSYDPRLAVNVNRRTDARAAEHYLRRTEGEDRCA